MAESLNKMIPAKVYHKPEGIGMMTKETNRVELENVARNGKTGEKTKKTGEESTLKNTVSCVTNRTTLK